MTITVEILSPETEKEYTDFLNRCPDALVQHSLDWRDAITSLGVDLPFYLIAKNDNTIEGILPLFLYKNPLGNILISTPQAGSYGGIVTNMKGEKREFIFSAICNKLLSIANENKCVLTTISTPVFSNDLELYNKYFNPNITLNNFYQYIKIDNDFIASMNSKQRNNLKRNLLKAENFKLTLIVDPSNDLFEEWYEIHTSRMVDIGASPLPKNLFKEIIKHLYPNDKCVFIYVKYENKIIAGALLIYYGNVLDIFMDSVDSNYLYTQANTFLIFSTIKWAQEKKLKYYNWQSSSSRDSNVYGFKASWGSSEGTHHYLTKVTGDILPLMKLPLATIKNSYQWHYLMPYNLLSLNRQINDDDHFFFIKGENT